MVDKSIPFHHMILRCDQYVPQPVLLPEGFSIVPYRNGYEKDWARLQAAVGDFPSAADAEQYFAEKFLSGSDAAQRAGIHFLQNGAGERIGSCTAWRERRQDGSVSVLHWLVVDAAYQGRGLGRALCCAVMNRFAMETEGLPVYLHTQPWSWKAILLYLSLGFRLQRSDSFAGHVNEYAQAMAALKGVVSPAQYQRFLAASDD